MFSRTSTLGTVPYKGQRALVVTALTDPRSGIPAQFTLQQVVAAIDPVAYDKTFKHGKMVVTIPESVHFHLKELAKLGQIEHIAGEGGVSQVAPTETPGFGPPVLQPSELLTEWAQWQPSRLPFVLDADRDRLESPQTSKSVVTLASCLEQSRPPISVGLATLGCISGFCHSRLSVTFGGLRFTFYRSTLGWSRVTTMGNIRFPNTEMHCWRTLNNNSTRRHHRLSFSTRNTPGMVVSDPPPQS